MENRNEWHKTPQERKRPPAWRGLGHRPARREMGGGVFSQFLHSERRRQARTVLAICLTICLTAGLMPGLSLADTGSGKTMVVTEFEPLADDIVWQEVPAGTSKSQLKLPGTLKALGYEENHAAEEGLPEATPGIAAELDDPMDGVPRNITITDVTWEADPAYDGAAEETYVFTARLKTRYQLDDGIELPQITVEVNSGQSSNQNQNSNQNQIPVATSTDALPREFAIITQPRDVFVPVGQTAEFQVEAEGEEVTFQWQKGEPKAETAENTNFNRDTAGAGDFLWSDITGAGESEYTFQVEEDDLDQNVYRCALSSGSESLTTKIVKVQKKVARSNTRQPEKDGDNIYANGVPLILAKGTGGSEVIPYTVIYLDEDGDGEIVDRVDQIWDPVGSNPDNPLAGNNLGQYHIFGGSKNTEITSDTKITVLGGEVAMIYGGGYANGESQNASVTGNCVVMVEAEYQNITNTSIYGGGYAINGGQADVNGDCSVSVKGAVSGIAGGGSALFLGSTAVCSNSLVEVSGEARVNTMIRGGGYSYNGGIAGINGTSQVIMSGNASLKDGDICGGGFTDCGDTNPGASVCQSSSVEISGNAKVNAPVYGGGWAYGAGADASISGDTSVTIRGNAEIGRSNAVYGGGYGTAGGNANVGGTSSITVLDKAKINSAHGGGFAKQNGSTATCQASSVNMSGHTQNGLIYGGGYGESGGNANVDESSTVRLTENATADSIVGGGSALDDPNAEGLSTATCKNTFVELSGNVSIKNGVLTGSNTKGADVIESKKLSVGGGVTFSEDTLMGIFIGEKQDNAAVEYFTITEPLTGRINVYIVKNYDASGRPVIAYGASASDQDHIRLRGSNAGELAIYRLRDMIKIKNKSDTTAVSRVTIQEGGTGVTGADEYEPGETVTIHAGTRDGYRFSGWTVTQGTAVLSSAESTATTFEMPGEDVTVLANWEKTGSTDTPNDPGNTDPPNDPGNTDSSDNSGSEGGGSSTGAASTVATSSHTGQAEQGGTMVTTTTTAKSPDGHTTTITTTVTKDAAGNTTSSVTTLTTDQIQIIDSSLSSSDSADAAGQNADGQNTAGQNTAGQNTAGQNTAGQTGSTVILRPDKSAINSAAAAAGGTAWNPLGILVELPGEIMTGELRKPENNMVSADIILPASASGISNSVLGVSIGADILRAARDLGKSLHVTLKDETGAVKAVWSLSSQALKGTEIKDSGAGIILRTTPMQSDDPAAKEAATSFNISSGQVLNISGSGILAASKLTVPATDKTGIQAGDNVTLYRYDPKAKTLTAMPSGNYVVDANGNLTVDLPPVNLSEGSISYMILPAGSAPTMPAASVR